MKLGSLVTGSKSLTNNLSVSYWKDMLAFNPVAQSLFFSRKAQKFMHYKKKGGHSSRGVQWLLSCVAMMYLLRKSLQISHSPQPLNPSKPANSHGEFRSFYRQILFSHENFAGVHRLRIEIRGDLWGCTATIMSFFPIREECIEWSVSQLWNQDGK